MRQNVQTTIVDVNGCVGHCPTSRRLLSLARIRALYNGRRDISVIVFPLFRPILAAFSKIILKEHVTHGLRVCDVDSATIVLRSARYRGLLLVECCERISNYWPAFHVTEFGS